MSQISKEAPWWKRLILSEFMLRKSFSQRVAYIGVMAALLIVANMFLEFKLADIQFSLTVFLSMLAGILIGPVYGFSASLLGDGIGFMFNSWGYVYMPWVGLSVAAMSLLAGLIVNAVDLRFRGQIYIKLAVACLACFVLCTAGISTIGFYYYFRAIGFSQKSLSFITEHFGVEVNFWTYLCYRLLTGQLYNCIANYILLFLAVPVLNAVKPLKLEIR